MTMHCFSRIGLSVTLLGLLSAGCSSGDPSGSGGTGTSTGTETTSSTGGRPSTSTGTDTTSSTGGAGGAASTTTTGTASTGSMTTSTGSMTTSSGSMSSGTGGAEPKCGDGSKDPGEECDLGAQNADTGACTTACKNAACGDGFAQAGEECDQGVQNADTGACTLACKSAKCGDGLLGPAEGCDLGAQNSDTGACTLACKSASCGDALVQSMVEDCDLGAANNVNTGACTTMCKNAMCGDSFVQTGVEECDLGMGNNADTGACTLACKSAKCGDSFVQAGTEECDLGAQNANTGTCTLACKNAKCGDGFKQGTEACDDGNAVIGDGCNNDCVISGTPVSTQTYTSPGGNSNWNGVVVDATGNVIVVGAESTAAQGFDTVVIKYDANGVQLWKQTFNDTGNNLDDVAFGVTVDASGNIFVVGSSQDTTSGSDIWTRKYSPAGAILWTKFFEGGLNLDDSAYGVAADASGNIYVTGAVQTTANQGTDIFVGKIQGVDGTLLWADIVNNAAGVAGGNDAGLGVAVRTAANVTSIAVTGYTAVSATQLDGWTRVYKDAAPTGTIQWTQTYAGAGLANDFGQSVTIDTTGSVIVAGGESVANQGFNTWVRKYSSAGVTAWTSKYNKAGVNLDDAPLGVTADATGSVIVTGYETAANARTDVWTEKLSGANGNLIWKQVFNGPASGDDAGDSVAVDAAGNVYVAGYIALTATNATAWLTKYVP